MNLLYFGDRHNRITTPENRVDDYQQNTLLKDNEIREIAKSYNVKCLLEGGDFWGTPNPPLDYASNIINQWFGVDVFDTLQKMSEQENVEQVAAIYSLLTKVMDGSFLKIEELQKELSILIKDGSSLSNNPYTSIKGIISMLGVAGNHELFGNNISTLSKTMIGFMGKLGLIHFVTKKNPYFLTTEDGLTIAITGSNYHIEQDTDEYIDDYVVTEKLGDFHIHIVHGYLTDKSKGTLIRHTTIDQIRHTRADLTITGHDHIGFPITKIDGKYFVNPGAIVRQSNDLKEIERKPKVLLIEITKKDGLKLKEIPLKSAKEGKFVLDRKKIAEKKSNELKMEEFKKAVNDANVSCGTDINDIIMEISENNNLPTDIKEDVINRVSEKMRLMNVNTDTICQDAYIDKLVIENFQSHEFTELELSRGFNVFAGESRQGKSSILRAINWVYENKPTGKGFIRKKAEFCKVTLYLSSGYIISRYVEAKKNGKNGYYIFDPNTGDTEFHNTKILSEVQKLLGFSNFVIDKDLQFNLNYSKQGTGWFLIGEQYTAPVKAKIIGAIYGTHYADAVTRDLELEEKRLNEKSKGFVEDITKTNDKISQYSYLPELRNSIDNLEEMLKQVDELQICRNQIENILNKRDILVQNIEKSKVTIESTVNVVEASSLFHKITLLSRIKDKIEGILNVKDDVFVKIQENEDVIHQTKDCEVLKHEFEVISQNVRRNENIRMTIETIKTLQLNIQAKKLIIEATSNFGDLKVLDDNLVNFVNQRVKKVEDLDKVEKLTAEKTDLRKKIQSCEKLITIKTAHYAETKKMYEMLVLTVQKKSQLKEILSKRETLVESIAKKQCAIMETKTILDKSLETYKTVLTEAGRCPVCLGTIEKVTINRIMAEYAR